MALHGRNASVKILTDTITDVYNWSIDKTANPIEEPVFGNDGWARTLGTGVNKWSGSFDAIKSLTDTNGQTALDAAWEAGTVVSGIRFYLDGTYYYSGSAYITGTSESTNPEDVDRVNYTFSGDGQLSYSW